MTSSAPRHASAPAARAARDAAAIDVRPLRTEDEYLACVALQRAIWGDDFDECVPTSLLKVTQRIGGVAAGAFDADGRLLGFVFGMTGIERGTPVHWSDMLGVRAEARDLGIGRRLKEYQRDVLLAMGVETMYWTYDPLVARNAHLNFHRLGVEAVEYVPDMYGAPTSVLHRGIGTDRIIVRWRMRQAPPSPDEALPPELVASAPAAGVEAPGGALPPLVRLEIPCDVHSVQAVSQAVAARWRETSRRDFLWCFARGYRVAGLVRAGDRCFYALLRDAAPAARP